MSRLICYCFEHTEEDIHQDVLENPGQSTVLEKILTAKKQGACQRGDKHPQQR